MPKRTSLLRWREDLAGFRGSGPGQLVALAAYVFGRAIPLIIFMWAFCPGPPRARSGRGGLIDGADGIVGGAVCRVEGLSAKILNYKRVLRQQLFNGLQPPVPIMATGIAKSLVEPLVHQASQSAGNTMLPSPMRLEYFLVLLLKPIQQERSFKGERIIAAPAE